MFLLRFLGRLELESCSQRVYCAEVFDESYCLLSARWLGTLTLMHFLFCVFSEYAEALTNPIKHLSQLDKREKQLAALLEEYEVRHVLVPAN